MKIFLLLLLMGLSLSAFSQDCGNCKLAPSIIKYDLDVRVPQPKLQGEKTEGWLPWLELYKIGPRILSQLSASTGGCLKFKQPASYTTADGTNILVVGATHTNLAPAKNVSSPGNYLFTGSITGSPAGYTLHAEIQSACSREKVAEANVNFKIVGNGDNTDEIAAQAMAQLSNLPAKIARFERDRRSETKSFSIAGNSLERIKITPARRGLNAGEQTEIILEVKDCDGQPLAGREILFNPGSSSPEGVNSTVGGTVTPSKVVTDAQGKAKASFKMSVSANQSAVIHAHIITEIPWSCNTVLTGAVQMDLMHAFKVTVSYVKTGIENFEADIDGDGVGMKADEQKVWDVHNSYAVLYYPAKQPKDGEQVMLMPQFENESPELKKLGKTIVLHNNGYSEYSINGSPLQLTKTPVGVVPSKTEREIQLAFSATPLPPSLSFIIEDNNLVFF